MRRGLAIAGSTKARIEQLLGHLVRVLAFALEKREMLPHESKRPDEKVEKGFECVASWPFFSRYWTRCCCS
jgi:hypothetical protein